VPPFDALISHGELQRWLVQYGYLAVFALVAIESVGVPLPGESMLIVAAAYAGAVGKISILAVVAVAAAGAIIGDNVGYTVGRFGGWRLLRRYGHYVRITERKLKLGRYLFIRHGGKVVFFGRFVGILRTYSAALAGANHMRFRQFFAFNASGGIVWAALYGFGYYYLADIIESLGTPFAITVTIIAVAVAVTIFVLIRRNMASWEERAERALPGPLSPPSSRADRRTTDR
jgi:membrane protein DedA with SNARE-associated domain